MKKRSNQKEPGRINMKIQVFQDTKFFYPAGTEVKCNLTLQDKIVAKRSDLKNRVLVYSLGYMLYIASSCYINSKDFHTVIEKFFIKNRISEFKYDLYKDHFVLKSYKNTPITIQMFKNIVKQDLKIELDHLNQIKKVLQ